MFKEISCPSCSGIGHTNETVIETDMTMSIVMGSAIGTGYFPMTKTVSKQVTCTACNGSGVKRIYS